MAENKPGIRYLIIVLSVALTLAVGFAGGVIFSGNKTLATVNSAAEPLNEIVSGQNSVRPVEVLLKPADRWEKIIELNTAEAKFLYDSGNAVFVDARGANEYKEGHIKGAVSIPLNNADTLIPGLKDSFAGKIAVTYCHGGAQCRLSYKVAQKLYEAGIKNTAIFFGGWPQWTQNSYPVEGAGGAVKTAYKFGPGVTKTTADGNLNETVRCPVSGKQITKAAASSVLEYKGKKYYLCCDDCIGPFNSNLEKYAN